MLQQFFDALKSRLEISRKVEEKLSRELAHRFNVLKYLNTREIGLSRIIKDLLDPNGCHGQRSFFLKILLEELDIDPREIGLNLDDARVSLERIIENDRRIDIYIEIPSNDRKYCLAFENKPGTVDRITQVIDYLKYLYGEYEERFWLIYLSPRGEPPDEISLPRAQINDGQWENSLIVMAYADPLNEENGFQNYRAFCSFVNWIAACHEKCRVDKLRWFLKDIETYCKKRFGGQHMPNDFETETVIDFLFEDADRLIIAMKVSKAWKKARNHVCEKFLEHLRARIKDKMSVPNVLNEFGEVHIDCIEDNTQVTGVKLSLPNWNDPEISICLWHDTSPYRKWFFGVFFRGWVHENNENDPLRLGLVDQLSGGRRNNDYPWWQRAEYPDWNCLIPELYRECQDERGKITDYFVEEFVRVSRTAIPIINNLNP